MYSVRADIEHLGRGGQAKRTRPPAGDHPERPGEGTRDIHTLSSAPRSASSGRRAPVSLFGMPLVTVRPAPITARRAVFYSRGAVVRHGAVHLVTDVRRPTSAGLVIDADTPFVAASGAANGQHTSPPAAARRL